MISVLLRATIFPCNTLKYLELCSTGVQLCNSIRKTDAHRPAEGKATMKTRIFSLCCLTAMLLTGTSTNASILVDINHPTGRNLDAPTGDLADSGWQYQGQWASFLGTPISPNHFITAKHVGGSVGGSFIYENTSFVTTAVFKDPNSDLAVWRIDGTFNSFAPLYTQNNEVNKEIVVIGRGTDRGDPVTVGTTLKGWQWGTDDHAMSWGQNTVTEIFTGDPKNPQTLQFNFDLNAGPNEVQLTGGDSGGGAFILDDGQWKLAGIGYAATGDYQFTADIAEAEFSAALFDQNGLFVFNGTGNPWVSASRQPGSSFVTRISPNIDWINSAIPEPSTGVILLAGGWLLTARRKRTPIRRG